MNIIGRLIAWGIFGLCSIVSTEVTSQEELTVRQVGQSLEFEFRLDHPSSFQLFYSINEGNTWSLINQDCLGPLNKLPNGRASVVWNVLECEESFVQEDVIFKLTAGSCSPVEFDGYTYDVVQIGKQCWFAENLRTTRFATGESIPYYASPANLADNAIYGHVVNRYNTEYDRKFADFAELALYYLSQNWSHTKICNYLTNSNISDEWEPLYAFLQQFVFMQSYYKEDANSLNEYGRLYSWYAVNDVRGLCPLEWRVPIDEDWIELINNFGGEKGAGDHLKCSSANAPGWNGTNASGFCAMPSGVRLNDKNLYTNIGRTTCFWSSTNMGTEAWTILLDSQQPFVIRGSNEFGSGLSVRCIHD